MNYSAILKVIFLVLLIVSQPILPVNAKKRRSKLPSRYLLTLTYQVSGNIQDSIPFTCQYALTRRSGRRKRAVYNSTDCGGNVSTVTITKTGKRVSATIPVDVVTNTTDGFNIVSIRREVDLNCFGNISRNKFINGTCSGSLTEFGIKYIFDGSFNASALSRNRFAAQRNNVIDPEYQPPDLSKIK